MWPQFKVCKEEENSESAFMYCTAQQCKRCTELEADQNWFQHFRLSQMLRGKGQYPIVPMKEVSVQFCKIYHVYSISVELIIYIYQTRNSYFVLIRMQTYTTTQTCWRRVFVEIPALSRIQNNSKIVSADLYTGFIFVRYCDLLMDFITILLKTFGCLWREAPENTLYGTLIFCCYWFSAN